jgi:hypothetical protein
LPGILELPSKLQNSKSTAFLKRQKSVFVSLNMKRGERKNSDKPKRMRYTWWAICGILFSLVVAYVIGVMKEKPKVVLSEADQMFVDFVHTLLISGTDINMKDTVGLSHVVPLTYVLLSLISRFM